MYNELNEIYELSKQVTEKKNKKLTEHQKLVVTALQKFEEAYRMCLEKDYRDKLNTKFEFMYRDASNYKKWTVAIVAGFLSDQQIDEIIECLDDGEYFIPEQVGLPAERFSQITEDDHCWCELEKAGITRTMQPPTEMISANDVYNAFCKSKNHWDDVKYALA